MGLAGKVAFVTGGAGGIGRGYTEALLEKGVKVIIADIDETAGKGTLAELASKFGAGNIKFLQLDVSSGKQYEEVFKTAVNTFGHIDIMVNNAGIVNEFDWQRMIEINLKAVIQGTKLAEDHMRRDRGGRGGKIISTCSVAGLYNVCSLPVYCATKHGIRSFMTAQADQIDREAQGIEYALICPDAVDTNMLKTCNAKTMKYFDIAKDILSRQCMPVSRLGEMLIELLELETMNGALLVLTHDSKTYQMLQPIVMGTSYRSAVLKQEQHT